MDTRFTDLRRRFDSDPADRATLTDLARALDQAGEELAAYELLADHGAVERDDPLALALGRRLAAEEPIEELTLTGPAFAAARLGEGADEDWRWLAGRRFRELGLPVRALSVNNASLGPDLREPLSKLRALRLLVLDGDGRGEVRLSWLGLSELGGLRDLSLYNMNFPEEELAGVARLSELRELKLYWCPNITHHCLRILAPLRALEVLELYGCTAMSSEALDGLAPFASLRRLELDAVTELGSADARGLAALTRLEDLQITGAGGLDNEAFLQLARLPALTRLWVSVEGVDDRGLARFAEAKPLEILRLRRASNIRQLAPLSSWPDLRELHIGGAPGLAVDGVRSLTEASALETLDFTSCPRLEDDVCEEIAGLSSLRSLGFSLCEGLRGRSLGALAALPELASLRLFSCEIRGAALSGISEIAGLTSLSLDHCAGIPDRAFAALEPLERLEELKLSFCGIGDKSLESIASLEGLKRLNIGYSEITDAGLATLVGLEDLEELNLQSCAITDAGLATLARFPRLRVLDLGGCDALSYEGFARLRPLAGCLRTLGLFHSRFDPERLMRELPFLDGIEC